MSGGRWRVAILVLALVARLGWALAAERFDPMLARNPLLGDAASYDRLARSLVAGMGLAEGAGHPTAFWPPGYPLFLSAVYGLAGHHLLAARLAQAALASLLALVVFELGVALFSRRAAVLAGLGVAIYPYAVYFGAWLIAESLYFAVLAFWLWMAWRLWQSPSVVYAIGWGVAAGAAALTKPTALMQMPYWVLWMLVALKVPLRARLQVAFAALAAFALTFAPWVARNYATFGEFVLGSTNGGYTFYWANNAGSYDVRPDSFPKPIEGLTEPRQDRAYYRLAWQWIRDNPGDWARLEARKFARLVSPLSVAGSPRDYPAPAEGLVRAVYGVFLATVLVGAWRIGRRRECWFLWIPIAGVVTSTAIFYGDVRYTLPAMPSLVLFAAAAFEPRAVTTCQAVSSSLVT